MSEVQVDVPPPNWEYDFIDFPTGWWLAARVDHNPGCSYRESNGALLCDDNANCHTIRTEWERRRRERDFTDTPPRPAR